MSHLYELRIANSSRDHEWDPQSKITPLFRAAEMAGEAGELANVVKKLEREKMGLRGSRASIQDLSEELADVIITVDLIGMAYGIDLWEAVKEKFNKTSHKQGLHVFIR